MTTLYAKMNEPPRYLENTGFEAYLTRYTEEIAGHVRLYDLEWWDCEKEEEDDKGRSRGDSSPDRA